MTDIRDAIAKAIVDIPTYDQTEPPPSPDDEIVAAIQRQLEVLEGTAVVLGNLVQMLVMQIANLRAEVALFGEPEPSSSPAPQPEVRVTPSGATVASSLPEAKREALEFCGHEDALIVQTADGPQKVCPDCDG